jgi:hypothetical protein
LVILEMVRFMLKSEQVGQNWLIWMELGFEVHLTFLPLIRTTGFVIVEIDGSNKVIELMNLTLKESYICISS